MEPASVITGSKTRFLKGLRRFCSSTGNKIHNFANKPSKVDANILDSSSNRYASASEEHSITSEQHSSILKIPAIALEQSLNAEISTPSITDKPNLIEQRRPNIDTLPDMVLLHLFTYLNAQDLCNLGWCAPNLCNVARRQKKFWQNVRHVCNGSSPCHRLLRPFLSDLTTTLHLSKATNLSSSDITKGRKDTCLEPNFFETLKNLPNLKSLTLENHSLKYRHMLNLKRLPKSLTELRLRRITLLDLNGGQCLAFEDLHLYLPNLEIVDVSHCSWMNSHILCSLSQCSRLEELIMFGCSEFNYVVPYLVTATICGFWGLETLDLRLTYATFYDIKMFKTLKNLKHILLERPKQTSIEGACRRVNLMYNNRLDFNLDLEVFQFQSATLTTEINTTDNAGGRRIFRLSEYFSTWLETLVVRNYSEITDSTLSEIERFFNSVKYLDVTGTKCTAERVAIFQNRCCPKLYNVVRSEKKFWKNIRAVCNGCSSSYIRLLPFLSDITTTLHLSKSTEVSSSNCSDIRIEPYFLKRLKQLPNLKSFALENYSLGYKHLLNLLKFPPKWLDLTELRLKKINLLGLNGQPCLAFEDLHLHLPNLEIVDVSRCSWVNSDVLWSLSKCSHLKTLIMIGCNEIEYIVPPYIPYDDFLGTSSIDGFCELETINLRLTDVTFEEIGIFKDLKNLKHVYLEKPKGNSSKMAEELERRRLILDHYSSLPCWWGVPLYILEDMSIGAMRVFRLSELVSTWLETLVARNYAEITDLALDDIKENLTSLKYLDITGTQCTAERVASFQTRCPEVTVCHDSIQF